LLRELAQQKELALKGKSAMSFDDFNYRKVNEAVLDLLQSMKPVDETQIKKEKSIDE